MELQNLRRIYIVLKNNMVNGKGQYALQKYSKWKRDDKGRGDDIAKVKLGQMWRKRKDTEQCIYRHKVV